MTRLNQALRTRRGATIEVHRVAGTYCRADAEGVAAADVFNAARRVERALRNAIEAVALERIIEVSEVHSYEELE